MRAHRQLVSEELKHDSIHVCYQTGLSRFHNAHQKVLNMIHVQLPNFLSGIENAQSCFLVAILSPCHLDVIWSYVPIDLFFMCSQAKPDKFQQMSYHDSGHGCIVLNVFMLLIFDPADLHPGRVISNDGIRKPVIAHMNDSSPNLMTWFIYV